MHTYVYIPLLYYTVMHTFACICIYLQANVLFAVVELKMQNVWDKCIFSANGSES